MGHTIRCPVIDEHDVNLQMKVSNWAEASNTTSILNITDVKVAAFLFYQNVINVNK